jgi:hypothetical protein
VAREAAHPDSDVDLGVYYQPDRPRRSGNCADSPESSTAGILPTSSPRPESGPMDQR